MAREPMVINALIHSDDGALVLVDKTQKGVLTETLVFPTSVMEVQTSIAPGIWLEIRKAVKVD